MTTQELIKALGLPQGNYNKAHLEKAYALITKIQEGNK